jgi:threonine dehydratase
MLTSGDFADAAAKLDSVIVRTPVRTSPLLDDNTGCRVFLKTENEQRCGSFKARGAFNAMLSLDAAGLRAGVVAASSGNHGLAVATAASALGSTAVVVIPRDCPDVKRSAISLAGARILDYEPATGDRDRVVGRVARQEKRSILPSADDPRVLAGAGTVALELVEQVGPVDVLVVPVGGGGLAAGCAAALSRLDRTCRLVGVEPHTGNDTWRSLARGSRVRIPPPATIADGLRHRTPGAVTFPILRRLLDRVVLVDDAEIVSAMRFLGDHLGLRAEPSGACALAAVLSGGLGEPPGTRVGVVISGGNIAEADALRLTAAATAGPPPPFGGGR